MNFSKFIISVIIAGVAIFAVSVIQNEIITTSGQSQTFTGSTPLVAPAIIGVIVFVIMLERLQKVNL